ncbi:hypothetical protein ACLKA6_005202 [Drosophila palustris]
MQGHAQNAKQLQHAAGDTKTSTTAQTMGQVLEWTMDLVLVLIRIRNAGKGGCMQHLVFVIYRLGQDEDEQRRTGTVLAKTNSKMQLQLQLQLQHVLLRDSLELS